MEPTHDQIEAASRTIMNLSLHEPPVTSFKGEMQDDGDFRLEVVHDDAASTWINVRVFDGFGQTVMQRVD